MDIPSSSLDFNHPDESLNNLSRPVENKSLSYLEKDIVKDGKELGNKCPPQSAKVDASNEFTSGVEDEDVVLCGDESTKDYDGNIDEDELLKDTDSDELKKNVDSNIQESELLTNSDTSNAVQFKNVEDGGPGTNQSVSSAELSCLGRHKEALVEVTAAKSCTNTEDENVISCTSKPFNVDTKDKTVVFPSSSNNEVEGDAEIDGSSSNKFCDMEVKSKTVAPDNTRLSGIEAVVKSNSNRSGEVENINSSSIKPSNIETIMNNNEDLSQANSNPNEVGGRNDNDLSNTLTDTENLKNDCTGKLGPEVLQTAVTTADSGNNENSKGSDDIQAVKYNNSENDGGTKFLHVDQDNTRPDESFESMETGVEDPFAQTSDEVMETSENSEKDIEMNKEQPDNTEVMNVDEITSNSKNEVVAQNEIESKESNHIPAKKSKEVGHIVSTGNMDSTNASILSHLIETEEDVINKEKCNEENNIQKQEESNLQFDKNHEICIVPDQVTKQNQKPNQENSTSENVTVNCNKYKTIKMSNKSKNKPRKSSSEESSDSEFEVGTKSGTRPKRNAAKKAESQIRVMSAVEQEVEQDDAASNDGDSNDVEEIQSDGNSADIQSCFICKKVGQCKLNILTYGKLTNFCDDKCFVDFREGSMLRPGEGTEIVPPSTVMKEIRSADIQPIDRGEFTRKCSECSSVVKEGDEKTLSWETMDFCSEECLGKYQQELGSHCANCKGSVQPASLGKYCVRFGYEVKQFCCSSCLEEFKKGLKVCSFCQKDISSGAEGFLAPVGDKGTFKDFCTQACMEKYEQMSSNQPPPPQMHPCHVCDNNKLVEVEVFFDSKVNKLCSDICFTAYKFANKLTVDRCDMCRKYFDKDADGEKFNIFYDGIPHNFCCKTCMNVYILAKRKIVPCNWCKVKKYNFDMIKRVQNTGQVLMMCSLNCLTLYQVSVNAVSSRRIKCDMCLSVTQAQYHLTMSDATIRNFCTYPCVMNFQQQYSKSPITLPGSDAPPIPTGAPKRVIQKNELPGLTGGPVPVISSVSSLANGQSNTATTLSTKVTSGKQNLVMRLLEPPACRNKNIQTRPMMNTKSVSCRPHSTSVQIQTEEENLRKPILIPIPVPIYIPCPMAMYSLPFPVPIPFPLPVPVPLFLPTTRNSIKGIVKEIKRIQEKIPTDPFEAELLMMADMVAGDKKDVATSSDSEPENEPASSDTRPNSDGEDEFSPEAMETNNTFGDDIMQIALKMATELEEPAVDLETQLPPATITQSENTEDNMGETESTRKSGSDESKGRKRSSLRSPHKKSDVKKRKPNQSSDLGDHPPPPVEETKPDALMNLKYTFGVNAWKSWVTQKNAEIEKLNNTTKKIKPLKTEILQLTADELNFSLSLFVKEVKKPNGTQYAPDTIYYLCLGIQQYLFENGRIDNIFTDTYFETFTDSLNEVAKKFTELFNDHQYIVTRVEEEHLWESHQLGAHSPHVLLSTLMFFNTKYFNLANVEEHMMLSFSHIMKHWKRNPNQPTPTGSAKAPGSRNVLLRFYPPQAVLDDPNSKKKKVYEQQENEDNPLRCPVKLYEFYLSKCPESVRSRSDVFYLQPERSCVPDSPVWYSTMALSKEPLEKMLNRVKMVKEINVALLMP